jgi:hypothetical protein
MSDDRCVVIRGNVPAAMAACELLQKDIPMTGPEAGAPEVLHPLYRPGSRASRRIPAVVNYNRSKLQWIHLRTINVLKDYLPPRVTALCTPRVPARPRHHL